MKSAEVPYSEWALITDFFDELEQPGKHQLGLIRETQRRLGNLLHDIDWKSDLPDVQ